MSWKSIAFVVICINSAVKGCWNTLLENGRVSRGNCFIGNCTGTVECKEGWMKVTRPIQVRMWEDFSNSESDIPSCKVKVNGGCSGSHHVQ